MPPFAAVERIKTILGDATVEFRFGFCHNASTLGN